MAIKRPCNRPRCPELVAKGYCPDHQPKREQTAKQRFYNKRRWRGSENRVGIRDLQLQREPLCEVNEKCDDPTVATHVHHIDGDVENNPSDGSNHMSTCNPCHTWWENEHGALR